MTFAPLPYFYDGAPVGYAGNVSLLKTIWAMNNPYAPFVYRSDGSYVTFYSPGRNADPRGVAVVGSQVWVVLNDLNAIARWTPGGASAGSDLTTNAGVALQNPFDLTVLPDGTVWTVGIYYIGVTGYSYIQRWNPDGTSAGAAIDPIPSTTGGLFVRQGTSVCAVGTSEVWVADFPLHKISRLTYSGTTSNPDLFDSQSTISSPFRLRMVGGDVWCIDNGYHYILRYHTDGTSAGASYTIASPAANYDMYDLCQVGPNEVWVAMVKTTTGSVPFIRRRHLDGTSAGGDITNVSFGIYLRSLAVVA